MVVLVGRNGIEPLTPWLKARCSAPELTAQNAISSLTNSPDAVKVFSWLPPAIHRLPKAPLPA